MGYSPYRGDNKIDQACDGTFVGAIDHATGKIPQDPRMAVARLTSSTPFLALAVRYELTDLNNTCCDATLAHRCDVWASTAATPEASPTVAESFQVPTSSTHAMRGLVHSLATPLALKNEHLYVAVELVTDKQATKALCLNGCNKEPGEDSFFSDFTTQPPHVWSMFKDSGPWGVGHDLITCALGFHTK